MLKGREETHQVRVGELDVTDLKSVEGFKARIEKEHGKVRPRDLTSSHCWQDRLRLQDEELTNPSFIVAARHPGRERRCGHLGLAL